MQAFAYPGKLANLLLFNNNFLISIGSDELYQTDCLVDFRLKKRTNGQLTAHTTITMSAP